jgi:hypothetical protein
VRVTEKPAISLSADRGLFCFKLRITEVSNILIEHP